MSSPELTGKVVRSRANDALARNRHSDSGTDGRKFLPRWKAVVLRLLGQREASVFVMLVLVAGYPSIASAYFLEPRNLLEYWAPIFGCRNGGNRSSLSDHLRRD